MCIVDSGRITKLTKKDKKEKYEGFCVWCCSASKDMTLALLAWVIGSSM